MDIADITPAVEPSSQPPNKLNHLSTKTKNTLKVLRNLKAGTSIALSCEKANVGRTTFHSWRKKEPRLAALAEAIIGSRVEMVEDALFQACMDKNITAIIFFLTNRTGDKWADKRALVNNTNIFSPKKEVAKNGEGDSVESVLERIDRFRADLIPPGDKE